MRGGDLAVREEPLALGLGEHAEHEPPHVGAVEGRHALHAPELALDAHDRRRAHGEVEVRAAQADDPIEQVLELDALRARVGRVGGVATAFGPVAVVGGPGAVHLADEAHELVSHRDHGVDRQPRSASRAASTCSSPGSSMATTTPSSRRSSATAR